MKSITSLFLASLASAALAAEPAALKLTETIPLPGVKGRFDHFAIDTTGKRLYLSCGEGILDSVEQTTPDTYARVSQTPTAPGARTCYFDPALDRLYLAVPDHGSQKAELRIYQPR
jgi:hypothetical protein